MGNILLERTKKYYREVNDNIIYILLSDTNSNFSKMEKWFLNTSFSHSSLALDRGLNEVYSFTMEGFIKEDIKNNRLLKNADYSLYELHLKNDEYDRVIKVLSEFTNEPKKYKYNITGLVRLILGIPVEREDRFFCSEFVAHIINSANPMYMDYIPRGFVSPEDLAHNRNFKLVEKGKNLGLKYPK